MLNFMEFIRFVADIWKQWFLLMAERLTLLKFDSTIVPLLWLFVAFIIIGMCINAYWKGAGE